MATAVKWDRQQSWLLGDITHQGHQVEVWQRACEEDVLSLEQVDRMGDAVLTTPSGSTAKIPMFWHVRVPTEWRRVLVVHPINDGLLGVVLRFPQLDIDIEAVVSIDPPAGSLSRSLNCNTA